MTSTLELRCDTCARVRVFTQPTCGDGHGAECPEWACSTCGAAVLIAPLIQLMDRSVRIELRRRRALPPGRRAAA